MPASKGFTLIELVLVILLLGFWPPLPCLNGWAKAAFETQTVRDELLTRLRLVQTVNMHEPANRCTQLVVASPRFAHRTYTACPDRDDLDINSGWDSNLETRGRLVVPSEGITLSLNNLSSFVLRFDQMGRPLGSCATGCTLLVSDGRETSRIKIESEGFIHESP